MQTDDIMLERIWNSGIPKITRGRNMAQTLRTGWAATYKVHTDPRFHPTTPLLVIYPRYRQAQTPPDTYAHPCRAC